MAETKVISLGSMTRSGSEINVPDGELHESINIIKTDNALKPIIPPHYKGQLEGQLLIIHKTNTEDIYVCLYNDTLLFYTYNEEFIAKEQTIDVSTYGEYVSSSVIGNTLIFSFSTYGLFYMLYKEQKYLALGSKPPRIDISFGLQSNYSITDNITINDVGNIYLPTDSDLRGEVILEDDISKIVTDSLVANANKFLAEEIHEKNKFIFPFLLRYAYRLYDGSLYMASAPILMTPSAIYPFFACITNKRKGETINEQVKYKIQAYVSDIDYQVLNLDKISQDLELWSDIIEGIEIFSSSPIYTYNQNGNVEKFSLANNYYGYSHAPSSGLNYIGEKATDGTPIYKLNNSARNIAKATFPSEPAEIINDLYLIVPPMFDEFNSITYGNWSVTKKIAETSIFYKLSTIKTASLVHERTLLSIEESVLATLEVQEVMLDDYNTHTTLKPKQLFSYNQRLNIANYNQELFKGFPLSTMTAYNNAPLYETQPMYHKHEVYVFIKEDNKEYVVKAEDSYPLCDANGIYFYPNPNAYKMVIVKTPWTDSVQQSSSETFSAVQANLEGEGSHDDEQYPPDWDTGGGGGSTPIYRWDQEPNAYPYYKEVALVNHPGLNGAYYFSSFVLDDTSDPKYYTLSSDITVSTNIDVVQENIISLSELQNPFYFPLELINTVSNGTIIALSSTTQALSEGQYGQFPLYIFTTEGIFAMQITSTGTYSYEQVVSRDIALSDKAITQTDGAILFATKNGLKLLSGSQVSSLSEILNGANFKAYNLPMFNTFYMSECFDQVTFNKFLESASIAYDYVDNLLWIINTDYKYSYVYSIKQQSFAKYYGKNFVASVNNYPDTIIIDSDNKAYSLYEKIDEQDYLEKINCIVVTRTIKFDSSITMKTIEQLRNKHQLQYNSKVKLAIYGSRNGLQWYRLNSLHGSAFLYYKFVYYCELRAIDRINAAVCLISSRYTNKIR